MDLSDLRVEKDLLKCQPVAPPGTANQIATVKLKNLSGRDAPIPPGSFWITGLAGERYVGSWDPGEDTNCDANQPWTTTFGDSSGSVADELVSDGAFAAVPESGVEGLTLTMVLGGTEFEHLIGDRAAAPMRTTTTLDPESSCVWTKFAAPIEAAQRTPLPSDLDLDLAEGSEFLVVGYGKSDSDAQSIFFGLGGPVGVYASVDITQRYGSKPLKDESGEFRAIVGALTVETSAVYKVHVTGSQGAAYAFVQVDLAEVIATCGE